MFGITPLTPAYGRDYKSLALLKADLLAGKDFKTAEGRYINLPQLLELGLSSVQVRYGKGLTKTNVVALKGKP